MGSGSIFYSLQSGNNEPMCFPFVDKSCDTPRKLGDHFKGTDGVTDLTGIMGVGVASAYVESTGQWVGSLDKIKAEHGYILQAGSAITSSITGALLPYNYTTIFNDFYETGRRFDSGKSYDVLLNDGEVQER